MEPRKWSPWKHAKYLKRMCPVQLNSTRRAYARLRETNTILTKQGADMMAPCSGTGLHDCDVLKHLSAWNSILAAIKVHMKEDVATRGLAVYFPIKTFDLGETTARIQRAVLLLHWLLIRHPCVVMIEVEDWGVFEDIDWFRLFCDGVLGCHSLKILRVNANIREVSFYRRLLKACASLQHLEQISFERIPDGQHVDNTAILAAVIGCNRNLSAFKVGEFAAVPGRTWTVLRALQKKQFLSHLTLGVTSFTIAEANLLTQMLNENNLLKCLHLEAKSLAGQVTWSYIASGVRNAKALVELKLVCGNMHPCEFFLLADALVHAQTVKTLILLDSYPVRSSPPGCTSEKAKVAQKSIPRSIHPFIYMVRRLLSLRSLTLDLLRFAPEDQRAFLKALARNESVQEVRVVPQNQGYPTTLSRIANETGTASRIHTSRIFMEEMNIEQLERGLHVDEVIFEVNSAFSNTEMLTMKICYDVPGTLHNITTMNILITGCIIDVNIAKELALWLQTTKYLEVLTLDLSANKEACMHLIEAISRNTSITTLGVERWCHSRSNAVVLADIVCSSKSIHTLTYHRESMVPSRAFFARLSDSIESNFTLARVSTFERKEDAKKWAIIQNVAIRNSTLVDRAARYVANLSFAKIDAEAFELVASSPLLRSQVQTLAAVVKCEAAKMIRQTIWNLRDMDVFMSVTGVVMESVVCEENRDGRPRLDTLPPECWHAIRRYLSVADVVSNGPNGS